MIVEIIQISNKELRKIVTKRDSTPTIICARVDPISTNPLFADYGPNTLPYKLSTGILKPKVEAGDTFKSLTAKLPKLLWHWIRIDPDTHGNIFNKFVKYLKSGKMKVKTDEWRYFKLVIHAPHPLETAKTYFIRKHDYEMAAQMRDIMYKDTHQKGSETFQETYDEAVKLSNDIAQSGVKLDMMHYK